MDHRTVSISTISSLIVAYCSNLNWPLFEAIIISKPSFLRRSFTLPPLDILQLLPNQSKLVFFAISWCAGTNQPYWNEHQSQDKSTVLILHHRPHCRIYTLNPPDSPRMETPAIEATWWLHPHHGTLLNCLSLASCEYQCSVSGKDLQLFHRLLCLSRQVSQLHRQNSDIPHPQKAHPNWSQGVSSSQSYSLRLNG